MGVKWITASRGIRYREHPRRKHGVRPDRYFTLRLYAGGKRIEEALGWASEGWTLARAQEELGKLLEAKRTGEGAVSLRERAEANRAAAEAARREQARQAEEEAQRERQEKTVSQLWERYAAEVIAVENRGRTVTDKCRIWEKRVKPAIGTVKVKHVTEADVTALVHQPFKYDASGQVTGGKAEGANIYRLLHHMFGKALLWGVRPKELGNPLENIKEPKVKRRERLLAGGELGAIMKALDKAEADGTEKAQALAVIRAAIYTGARISELLTLRWEDVRRDEMELHLVDTKTGFSRRPMSEKTLALLDKQERMPGSAYVFRGIEDPKKPLDYFFVSKVFSRIRKAAGLTGVSLHTIRHWFATMTANTISNPRVGMALTGHKSHAAYMNYVHGDKEQARALADQLAKLATGFGTEKAKVVALRKGQRRRAKG